MNRQSSIVNRQSERLFTFASGGWVVLLTIAGCLIVCAWALAPVVMRELSGAGRAPGDGRTIESYGFDLSNLNVPREFVVAAMLQRDMIPTLDQPSHSTPDAGEIDEQRWRAMQQKNDPKYGKYLLPGDAVIGVEIDGESRAYPLHVLYVHEIVNDTLAGTPIAVTYNWPCGSAMVFDRRVNAPLQGTAVFAHSGLLYNSNLLMYDRHQTREGKDAPAFGSGNEILWCQLTGRPISGSADALKSSLTIMPSELTTWADWSARHPNTTVLDRRLDMYERYKDAAPTQYFKSKEPLAPVQPMVDEAVLPAKSPVLAVITSEACRVYPVRYVLDHATPMADSNTGLVEWRDTLGERTLRFVGDPKAGTLRVECDPPDSELLAINALWFAWHAMHPEDELFRPTN